jgi:hypothetical protein
MLLFNSKKLFSFEFGKLLMALAKTVILGSRFLVTHDHGLLCESRGNLPTVSSLPS